MDEKPQGERRESSREWPPLPLSKVSAGWRSVVHTLLLDLWLLSLLGPTGRPVLPSGAMLALCHQRTNRRAWERQRLQGKSKQWMLCLCVLMAPFVSQLIHDVTLTLTPSTSERCLLMIFLYHFKTEFVYLSFKHGSRSSVQISMSIWNSQLQILLHHLKSRVDITKLVLRSLPSYLSNWTFAITHPQRLSWMLVYLRGQSLAPTSRLHLNDFSHWESLHSVSFLFMFAAKRSNWLIVLLEAASAEVNSSSFGFLAFLTL